LTYETQGIINADHPCLAGHFPDNPIVPGVVILDEIFCALAEWKKNSPIAGISHVKFLAPIKPGQAFIIKLSETGPKRVNFSCGYADTVFVSGKVTLK